MIQVIQEHHGAALFDRLAADLARQPPAPLEEEIVLVESLGMARRLPLELARRLGSMARLATPFPARFIWERLLRPAHPGLGLDSPWDSGALAWRIAGLLETGDHATGPAGRLLADDGDGRLRHDLARRLAELFDQYLVYRPGLLLSWEGRPHHDLPGATQAPPESPALAWQRELWLRLSAEIAPPHQGRLLADWLARMAAGEELPGLQELPRRLSLCGLHGLPPAQLAVFDALSRRLELRVYLLNPSCEYWGDLPRRRRRELPPPGDAAPLLQAHGAELGGWIDQLWELETDFHDPAPLRPVHGTLLESLQQGLVGLEPQALPVQPDGSLQFHSCHSLIRQVEVMVDCLLDLFERHPGLGPGDVLVLCPDLEAARPALEAVLDAQEEGRRLPWRLLGGTPARSLGRALVQVLELAGGRWESAAVLAPLACPALRRRLGIAADHLPRLLDWCRETGVRWGWDAAERAGLDLPALDEHGWRAGLDRLLLGYAMSSPALVQGVLPHAEAGDEPELLEAWLGWLALLREFQAEALLPRPAAAWFAWLSGWLPRLLEADEEEEGELQQLRASLLAAEGQALLGNRDAPVSPAAGRDALRLALEPVAGIHGGGFDGRLTVAPMLAAHGLPAEVVVLLGLDDQVFPRPGRRDELDLCLARPLRGDRRPREQDRGQFLDALCAARRALLMFWNGRDPQENARRPASVVVSELLDQLGRPEGLVTEHALQGFSPRCYSGPLSGRSFHQGRSHAAARLATRDPVATPPGSAFLEPLPLPPAPDALSLEDLVAFFRNPAQAFLRRAGVRLPWDAQPLEAHEPFTLDPRASGRLRRRLLELRRDGVDPAGIETRLRATGLLPWGRPGQAALEELQRELELVLEQEEEALGGERPLPRELRLDLAGLRLEGSLTVAGSRRVELQLYKLPATPPLEAWIRHLAWCCLGLADGDAARRESLLIFRDGALTLPCPADPGSLLAQILERWRDGQTRWLPWLPRVSEEIARHCAKVENPRFDILLEREWFQDLEYIRDDPWLRLALGGADPFSHPLLAPRVFELALELGRPPVEVKE